MTSGLIELTGLDAADQSLPLCGSKPDDVAWRAGAPQQDFVALTRYLSAGAALTVAGLAPGQFTRLNKWHGFCLYVGDLVPPGAELNAGWNENGIIIYEDHGIVAQPFCSACGVLADCDQGLPRTSAGPDETAYILPGQGPA
jgi:hypothetical protein